MVYAKIEQKTFEEMNLPEVLYKYRCWNNTKHKNVITEREVFMAEPRSFEDTLDCKLQVSYTGLSKKEIREVCLYHSRQYYPDRNRREHGEYAKKWRTESPFGNLSRTKQLQEQMFDQYNAQIGVLSLTANVSNLAMWEKYSDNHKGFAVGFNPLVIFKYFGGGGPVIYYDILPIVRPTPMHSYDQQRDYQVYSKLSKWSFEEEYRTYIFRHYSMAIEDRLIQLPPEAYIDIVIGADMSDDMVEDLLNSIPPDLEHIIVKYADKKNMY